MSGDVDTILIVEDDRLSAEYLKEMLEDAGYIVVNIISSAEEAIVQSKLKKPDLILMDIMLKEKLSGCEAAVEIKQNQKNCKIVFLTAHAQKEMIDYATLAQADGYLLKPYRDEEILATISVVLSHSYDKKYKNTKKVNLEYDFSFDFEKRHLSKDGKQIPLNKQKVDLIELLANNLDTTVSNEQICHTVWGESKSDSTLRSLIHRTKELLGHELIKNANGIGYTIRSL